MIRKIILAVAITAALAGCNYGEVEHHQIGPAQMKLTATPGKVKMFFWYGCVHCYKVHQNINIEGDKDRYEFIATTGNKTWTEHARHFYAMKELHLLDKLDDKFFDFVIEHKSNPSESDYRGFLKENGVDEHSYFSMLDSSVVDKDMDEARQLASQYAVKGVPSIFIDGNRPVSLSGFSSYSDVVKSIKAFYQK
jgi:thiol:disulfide interchange protein DsbA